jgi:hypothetical protein
MLGREPLLIPKARLSWAPAGGRQARFPTAARENSSVILSSLSRMPAVEIQSEET